MLQTGMKKSIASWGFPLLLGLAVQLGPRECHGDALFPGYQGRQEASLVTHGGQTLRFGNTVQAEQYLTRVVRSVPEGPEGVTLDRPSFTIVDVYSNGAQRYADVKALVPVKVSESVAAGSYPYSIRLYDRNNALLLTVQGTLKVKSSVAAANRYNKLMAIGGGALLIVLVIATITSRSD